MNDKRKEYLKKWREDNKEYIRKYKKEYYKTHDNSFKKLQDKCKQLQQENEQQKEIVNSLNFIRNRKNQGCSQETINKMAIEFVNNWLNEVSE